MKRALVLLVFLLSGAAGLIYQVVWTRKLVFVLGVTSQATATVLAVFMGGLALGSWWLARYGDRVRSPVRLYGRLELLIAGFGLASLWILDALVETYSGWRRAGAISEATLPVVRVVFAGLALLAPTTLMGATLPVLLRGLSRGEGRLARDAGLLYAVNTLGAVLGTLATAWYLVQTFGLRQTAAIAAGLNVLAGLGALALGESRAERSAAARGAHRAALDPRIGRAVLLAFGLSGAFALAYEVLWTRSLIYVLGQNSVYAFSTMLASFLIGIVLGSLAAAWLADRARDRVGALGLVIALVGASALATIPMMQGLASGRRSSPEGGWLGIPAKDFLECLAVLIVPTTLSGSTFAIVARLFAREPARLGADVGRAYAANTLGAILGALAGGFVVLPVLGLWKGLLALGTLQVLVGLWLATRPRPEGTGRGIAALAGSLALVAAIAALASEGPTRKALVRGDATLLYYGDGPESSVAVLESKESGERSLVVDGDEQSGTGTRMQIHLRLLGHLPAFFHPAPRKGLVVGLGAGVTTGCLLQHPLDRVDQIELSKNVIAASPLFARFNHDPLNDPKLRLVRDDGRNFLLSTGETYDVITCDPFDADDAGVTSLYCREYYELVRSRLNPGGLACQWITEHYDPEETKLLVRTFQSVFPHASIWFADFTLVVVGSVEPPSVTLADLRRRFEDPKVKASLEGIGIDGAETLLSLLLAGPRSLRAFLGEGPVNTDDLPLIEYLGPREDPDASGAEDLWRPLLALRRDAPAEWMPTWTERDERDFAPCREVMDLVHRRDALEREMWELDDGAGPPSDGDPHGERRARELETARAEEGMERAALDATWEILACDAPRLFHVLAGVEVERPASGTTPASLDRFASALALGLADFHAGRYSSARARFRAASAAVPGMLRADLLAAACDDLSGASLDAARALLAVDLSRVGGPSELRWFARRMIAQTFRRLEAEPEGSISIGEELASLLPPESERPERPAPREWWMPRDDGERHPRPDGAARRDPDAWRLWWRSARFELEGREGRFAWRREEGR
ncbi:MAG TPA: fused MFS/spermidine synthase [Planctomycetota bacterium]|jgi:predicted membrane-bound spermidine synthase|nr:fused MFS/spermidine synthase [Planctomycetota bacterium]